MLLDGARGDPELRGDLGVRLALGDEFDDLALSRREIGVAAPQAPTIPGMSGSAGLEPATSGVTGGGLRGRRP
jgi:hypothetical protein